MLSSRPIHAHPEISLREGWSTKTPGRGLKGGRENAAHAGAMTLNAKPKPSRTPFHHGGTVQFAKDVGPSQNVPIKPMITVARAPTRPLGDKTPFPNRVGGQYNTPLPQALKFPNLLLLDPETNNAESDTVQRPSTARKHARVPRSASKSFETPMNKGGHWDISEGSIVLAEADTQEAALEDDCDEIEYMAPNTVNLPYTPPIDFELPDYKIVGKTLLSLAHSCPYDDSPPPELSMECDDPFHQAKMEQQAAMKPPMKSDSRLKAGHVRRATSTISTSTSAIRPRLPRSGVPASSLALSKPPTRPLTQTVAGTIPAPRSISSKSESLQTAGLRHTSQTTLTHAPKNSTASLRLQRPGTALANPSVRAQKTITARTIVRPTTSASVYGNRKPSAPAPTGTKSRRLGETKSGSTQSTLSSNDDMFNLVGPTQVELEDFRFDI
ncbi:hypothetical protein BD779DRAFT_1507284 [Infundibulicybe gibba]|nr:hypothetical protein BD779DRAFT_1507284 [Infundibulicybe gibba]